MHVKHNQVPFQERLVRLTPEPGFTARAEAELFLYSCSVAARGTDTHCSNEPTPSRGSNGPLSPSPTSILTSTATPNAEPTRPTAASALLTTPMTAIVISSRVRLPRPPTLLRILIGLGRPCR